MKGQIAIIGNELSSLKESAEQLTSYGLNVEVFSEFEPCLSEIIQGVVYDAIVAEYAPPRFDAVKMSRTVVSEHGYHIPFILVADQNFKQEKGRLSLAPGVFSVHIAPVDPLQISQVTTQAAAQRQLFSVIEQMTSEHRKLMNIASTLKDAIDPLITSINSDDTTAIDEQLRQSREKLRGRDITKELQRSQETFSEILTKSEKIRKFTLKS